MQAMKLDDRTAHQRLARICFIDYDREMPWWRNGSSADGSEIVAVGRLSRDRLAGEEAEFSLLVGDPGRGVV